MCHWTVLGVADRFYDNFIVTDNVDIKGCETYSPSLKFSAPNMLGNPFYGAHLKTNVRWHQILNPVSSLPHAPACLWTLVQMSLGKRVEGVGRWVGGGWKVWKKFLGKRISRGGEAFARNKRRTLKPMEREHWKEQLERKTLKNFK